MMQTFSDPTRETDPHTLPEATKRLVQAARLALPDLQHYVSTHGPGPDVRLAGLLGAVIDAEQALASDPIGPFDTQQDAINDAQGGA